MHPPHRAQPHVRHFSSGMHRAQCKSPHRSQTTASASAWRAQNASKHVPQIRASEHPAQRLPSQRLQNRRSACVGHDTFPQPSHSREARHAEQ